MIYVMSDIHGNTSRFNSIMKQINLQGSDKLYILGDVIDRYPDGIKLIRKIMKADNIHMLLGNHEYMMLEALVNNNDEDIMTQFEKENAIHLWYRNGGRVTHNYLKHIRKELRTEVFDYLNSLPTNIEITVNGTKYLLVHGSPEANYEKYNNRYSTCKEYAVWKRWQIEDTAPEGYTLIFGHTPTVHFSYDMPPKIYFTDTTIGIDCGGGFLDGRLACLRLDDMKIFYSEESSKDTEII